MGIKTDSTPVHAAKPRDQNVLYRLLQVMSSPEEFQEIDRSWRAGGRGYGDYKKMLLDLFHKAFDPARKTRNELMADPATVERALQDGARRARGMAEPVIAEARRAVRLACRARARRTLSASSASASQPPGPPRRPAVRTR